MKIEKTKIGDGELPYVIAETVSTMTVTSIHAYHFYIVQKLAELMRRSCKFFRLRNFIRLELIL